MNKNIPNPKPAMYDGFCKMCGKEVIKNKTLISSWEPDVYFCLKCHKELLINKSVIPHLKRKVK